MIAVKIRKKEFLMKKNQAFDTNSNVLHLRAKIRHHCEILQEFRILIREIGGKESEIAKLARKSPGGAAGNWEFSEVHFP